MNDNLDIDRLSYFHHLFSMLLHEDGQSNSLLLAQMPWALSLLVSCNPDIRPVQIPSILTHEATCLKLAGNIPPVHAVARDWWRAFWRLHKAERFAIQRFANSRIQHWLNVITMDITMEFTSK